MYYDKGTYILLIHKSVDIILLYFLNIFKNILNIVQPKQLPIPYLLPLLTIFQVNT